MPSRLLSDLNARIAKCRDPLENTCLRAEKAALLARQGELDAARRELAQIHSRYDHRPNAVVSAWVSLAEGLVIYFDDLGGAARDKIRRSLALSEAVGAKPITALSAAWLGQMDYSRLDFEPMLRHLPLALRSASADQHSALSRASLIVAVAYHWAERFDLARPWYAKAHLHATTEGDDPTISALMHNMTWLRAAEARRASVVGAFDNAEVRRAQMGAESTGRFDELVGMAALATLVPLLRAQILVLLEQYAEALAIFEATIDKSIEDGLARMACVLYADTAWCRLRMGDISGAVRDAGVAAASVSAQTHMDDRAMTHSRLANIYSEVQQLDMAREHTSHATEAWSIHTFRQSELVIALGTALEGLVAD